MNNVTGSQPTQPICEVVQELVQSQNSPVYYRIVGALGSGIGSSSAAHAYNLTTSIVNETKLANMAIGAAGHCIPVQSPTIKMILVTIFDTHKYNFALIIGGLALTALCFKVAQK